MSLPAAVTAATSDAAADKRETHESTGQNKCQFLQFHRKASSNEIKSKKGCRTQGSNPSHEGTLRVPRKILRNVLRASH